MSVPERTRVDLHVHSTASEESRLGVQRAVGLPECATPPQEVYELAKRRGMDFVTITDHDTIDGVLTIAERPDVFVSEELTASFRGEPQAVHVLCYGITPADHEWLRAHNGDVEECAQYLHAGDILCALAHPYYNVGAPLTARHRRRLADLFPIWEVRNGSRARELNRPAAIYIGTREGTGIGGSDDHAGVDIGRTFTEAPPAATPAEYLAHVRAGNVVARGAQGSAAKWAHAAIALAARALGSGTKTGQGLNPHMVMLMMQRLLREGDARHGASGSDLTPDDARCLLRAWLIAVELDHLDERGLIAYMQEESFSHSDLYRRASRAHERKLRRAIAEVVRAIEGGSDLMGAATGVFEGCIAAIPYAPAAAFLSNEKAKLYSREGETPRVAILADGIGSTHGVTRTIEEIRERGVPGFEIEVIGTDADVDRRLSAVAEIDVPFYPGLKIGVPSLSVAVETLAEGSFDAIHVCSPGGGPEQEHLRECLGEHATFLGWLEGMELARAYANADIFLFPSATDTFGQVILEAQASGLPVVAVARGGPSSLIEHGVSGLLCEPKAQALAERVLELAASPLLRRRLATAGLAAVCERTWESALRRLAGGYQRALAATSDAHGGDTQGHTRDGHTRDGHTRDGHARDGHTRDERHAA
jgi:glycosyltransferase involved in cell wall biosynthesis/predicted metal-dependent phosphoesterase TrpH